MTKEQARHPDTVAVQGCYKPENGQPRVIPIVQSTTYQYNSTAEMARLFDLETDGYFYSRIANPTTDAVAAKIAALEGGVGAVLTSSGQAANFYAVFNIVEAGDHLIASSAIYGGTYNLLSVTMRKMGVDVTFVPPDASVEQLLAACRPNTKAFFGETLSNPSLAVLDFDAFSKAAHQFGVPLIVDNTFPTPVNCRPFTFGADIVTHSTSKYMDGHAAALGGVVVDSGSFDWMAHRDRFPGLCEPDDSYHGLIYPERFGKEAYIRKMTAQLMRDLGAVAAPMNAFLLNLGLESLPLRVHRHCENARAVADFLKTNAHVSWVNYPDLPDSPSHARAMKYLPNGSCGVISFGVHGGRAAAASMMDRLRLASIVTHVADARTCILHPAGTTHRQLNEEQLHACGVPPELLRLSVGLEDVRDIIADLEQALSGIDRG